MNPDVARYFHIEPGLTYLNHGSFGACPTAVLAVQTELRDRMEADAVQFMDVEVPARLASVRECVGELLGARPDDLVFVPNTTNAVNAVLRSIERSLQSGDELLTTDHEYNATLNALQYVAAGRGARVVVAPVPFPVRSPQEVVDAVLERATSRTRLAMFSWVTSATAVIFPVEHLSGALADRGVEVLVDAAHAPGMVPVNLAALEQAGVTYLSGNGHKWLCSPKGAAFLWVRPDRQAEIHPLVISHGMNAPALPGGRSRFQLEFDWPGTDDPTAVLSLPAAIDFLGKLEPGGWPGLMAANHQLALEGRRIVAGALGGAAAEEMAPAEMLGSMATLPVPGDLWPLPARPTPEADADATVADDPLHRDLLARDRIQVPVYAWPARWALGEPRRYVRISAQRYNDAADYRRLAEALRRRVNAPAE